MVGALISGDWHVIDSSRSNKLYQNISGSAWDHVDSKSIMAYLVEMMCRSRSGMGLFVESCTDLGTVFWIARGIRLGGANHFGDYLQFWLKVKI